jgi:hypothetical protein
MSSGLHGVCLVYGQSLASEGQILLTAVLLNWIADLNEFALPFLDLPFPAEWSSYVTHKQCVIPQPTNHVIKLN